MSKAKEPQKLGQLADTLARKIIGEVPADVCLFLILARRDPIGEVGHVHTTDPEKAQAFIETLAANKAFLPTPPVAPKKGKKK